MQRVTVLCRKHANLRLFMKNEHISIDEYDSQILRILQSCNRISAERIADEVHLSPSAIQRRLNKLRRNKIIEADVSLISPSAMGLRLTAIVEILFENEHRGSFDDFEKQMLSAPEVLQCYYVTGEADFIAIIVTRDTEHYKEFTEHYFINNPAIRKFTTNVVMKRVKLGLALPF